MGLISRVSSRTYRKTIMSRYRVRTSKKRNGDYLFKDKECKNCKSNSKNKPDLILKINICGHSYCTDCVHSVFRTGEAACEIDNCGFRLKQAKFRAREFEDETTDKEMHFRKLIEKDNEELSRKRKEWKNQIDQNKQYEEYILKKHRDEDQAKLTK